MNINSKIDSHQQYLWLGNAEGLEELRMSYGKFDDFLDLLDLVLKTTNHIIGGIRNLLDHHERYQRIHLTRENLEEPVGVALQSYPDTSL